jgi:hypothetical protein
LTRELKEIAPPKADGYDWLSTLAKQLSDRARLEIDEINDLLDVDIRNDERFRQWGPISNWYSPYHPRPNWPGYEAWENHLNELAEMVKDQPLDERVNLIPHSAPAEVRPLSVAPLPGREEYIVYRLPSSLGEIFAVPNWEDKTPVYMPEELAARAFDHDLITSERIPRGGNSYHFLKDLLLSEDLEMVETTREMEVWTAKYDGRDLKPYEEVKAPLPQDEDTKARTPGSPETMGKLSANYLFYSFNIDQNQDLQADGPWIVNETGIPADQVISWEGPYFHGAEGPEIARRWFAEQFGITFTVERRPMEAHLVRNRADSDGS